MYCCNCGKRLIENALYCHHCGAEKGLPNTLSRLRILKQLSEEGLISNEEYNKAKHHIIYADIKIF